MGFGLFCLVSFSPYWVFVSLGMEDTWNEYQEWRKVNENGDVPISVRRSYEEALKALEKIKTYEADIVSSILVTEELLVSPTI